MPIASNKLSTPWNCTIQKILLLVNFYFTLSRSLQKADPFLFFIRASKESNLKLLPVGKPGHTGEHPAMWRAVLLWCCAAVLWADFKTLLNYHALKKLSRRSDHPIILLLTISRSKWDSSLIEIASICVVEKHPICKCTFSSKRFSKITLRWKHVDLFKNKSEIWEKMHLHNIMVTRKF